VYFIIPKQTFAWIPKGGENNKVSLHTIQNYHFVIFVYIINTNQALVVQIIPSTHNINKESPKKGEKKSDDDVVNNVKKTKKTKKK
jgi:hypothetical protein